MAQRVKVLLFDDLDGSEADQTVAFALDGQDYQIDLSTKNVQLLRDALAPFVASARKAGRPTGSRRAGATGRTRAVEPESTTKDGPAAESAALPQQQPPGAAAAQATTNPDVPRAHFSHHG
jgi:hypothetical protein